MFPSWGSEVPPELRIWCWRDLRSDRWVQPNQILGPKILGRFPKGSPEKTLYLLPSKKLLTDDPTQGREGRACP